MAMPQGNALSQQRVEGLIPSWALFMSTIFILIIVDVNAILARDAKTQYIVVVLPILFMLTRDFERNQKIGFWVLTLLAGFLWIFGMSGVYWGKIVERQTDGALPLIWPLAVLMFANFRPENNVSIERGVNLLAHLANLMSFEGVIARLFIPDSLFNFSHEKAFLVVFSIWVGVLFNNKKVLITSAVLFLANFWAYPALTYVLAISGALFFVMASRDRFSMPRFLVFQLGSIFYLYYSTLRIGDPLAILDSTYRLLNRDNNVEYRQFLINQVTNAVLQSPFYGSGFRRSVLVSTGSSALPIHNDFVTISLGGGIFSLVVYLCIYIIINYLIFKNIHTIDDPMRKKAIICLGALINAYFFCSTANPISMKPQNGMILIAAIFSVRVMLNESIKRQRLLD
jgi:O-antigen ligase